MLYGEQISNALIITSGWMAGLQKFGTVAAFQRLHQLGEVRLLIDLDQQVVSIFSRIGPWRRRI